MEEQVVTARSVLDLCEQEGVTTDARMDELRAVNAQFSQVHCKVVIRAIGVRLLEQRQRV